MNLRRVRAIFRKELLDMLRDRRTVIAMIGVPIVLYPLLFIFGTQAAMVQQDKLSRSTSRVAVAPGTDPIVTEWLGKIPQVSVLERAETANALYSGDIDAIVDTPAGVAGTLHEGGSVDVDIRYDAAESGSRQAMERLEEGLEKTRRTLIDERLAERGLDRHFIQPIAVGSTNVAPPTKTTGALLGMVLPMVMVIMLGVGAFYPAIDLTAGEKERGTFETLLSTPTSTQEIVFGKFLTVFCLSLLAGFLNLGSLLLTLGFQFAQLKNPETAYDISMPLGTVVLIAMAIVPLAFFISALMMTVAMFAKTFKEAQNFVTPFFMLIMFPAVFAAIPGTELSPPLYFVPIANVALLFKDLMTQQVEAQAVFAVLVSTAAYAIGALLAAVWIFKREEMILAEERGMPFTLARSQFVPRLAPSVGMGIFLYALVLVMNFYIGTYAAQEPIVGLLVTEWLVIFAPTLFYLWFARVRLRTALSLHAPTPMAITGTVLMALAWAVIVVQLSFLQNKILPMPKELQEGFSQIFDQRESLPALLAILFAAALSPAICEETLFRGALLSAFRRRMPTWMLVIVIGFLFGLLHVSIHRMLVTTASGILLTYLVVRTGSIYTSILAHFLLNGTAIVAATRYQEILDRYRIEENGEPLWLIAAAAVVLALGILIVERAARIQSPAPAPLIATAKEEP